MEICELARLVVCKSRSVPNAMISDLKKGIRDGRLPSITVSEHSLSEIRQLNNAHSRGGGTVSSFF